MGSPGEGWEGGVSCHRGFELVRLPGATSARAIQLRPFTGKEYIESLRDEREVYIYGERVADVTTHPAFRNSVRSIAEAGLMREAGSYTPKCATTVGA